MTTPNSVAATTDPLSEAYITDVLADLERTSSTNAGAYEGDVARRDRPVDHPLLHSWLFAKV